MIILVFFLFVGFFLYQQICLTLEKKSFQQELSPFDAQIHSPKSYQNFCQRETKQIQQERFDQIYHFVLGLVYLTVSIVTQWIFSTNSFWKLMLWLFIYYGFLLIGKVAKHLLFQKKERISKEECLDAFLDFGLPLVFTTCYYFLSQKFGGIGIIVCGLCIILILFLFNFFLPKIIRPFLALKPMENQTFQKRLETEFQKSNLHFHQIKETGVNSFFSGNAFVLGFGKKSILVLDKDLFSTYSEDEIISIVYHELGHKKKQHTLKKFGIVSIFISIGTILLYLFYIKKDSFTLLHSGEISQGYSYWVILEVFFPIFWEIIQIILTRFSWKCEYSADEFAKKRGYGWFLTQVLKKNERQEMKNLTPNSYLVWSSYSHPTFSLRKKKIEGEKKMMNELKNATELSIDEIKQWQNDYEKRPTCKIMENALSKNALADLIQMKRQREIMAPNFSIELKTRKVTNQKASGRCWIFAGMNVLREIVANRCNIENFELSQNYIAFYDKLEKFNYALESIISLLDRDVTDRTLSFVTHEGICDGGQWDMLVSIIKKYGIVPKSAMDETYQSSNTRDMNFVMNTQIRRFASIAKSLYAEGKTQEISNVKKEMVEKMYRFLCMGFGTPIEHFDFEYTDKNGNYHLEKNYTPITFFAKYIGDTLDDYVSVVNAPTLDKPFYHMLTVKYIGNVVGGTPIHYLNLPMNEVVDCCLKQLKGKEPVWFGSDCGKYADRINGYWDDEAYDYLTPFDFSMELDKKDMLDYGQSAMNHAMVITGVTLNEQGAPLKWKIENSWGDDKAMQGYFVMSEHWFEQYVFQAVIHKKYLTPDQQLVLDEKPIELEPWDPMGTLAKAE